MQGQSDIFEKIGAFFQKNPKYFSVFIALVGGFMILASIFNWDWIFAGHSFNLKKIEGIANMFGRGIARIFFGISGVLLIGVGILWGIIAKPTP
jgi:hypothetical protein